MPATTADPASQRPRRAAAAALYAAGFTTAFGAHSIAANLGGYIRGQHESLLALGVLLALYDGAEVLLKPVFGALADRVGPRPVLRAGWPPSPCSPPPSQSPVTRRWSAWRGSGRAPPPRRSPPAAGTLVARLNPQARQGRAFGG